MSENVSNSGHLGNLSTAQRKAVEALADGATMGQAAAVAGRTRRTMRRWLAEDPTFQAALQEATSVAISDSARRLASLLDLALTALKATLEDRDATNSDRLRAVQLTLAHALRLTELADIERRLTELEAAKDESKQR